MLAGFSHQRAFDFHAHLIGDSPQQQHDPFRFAGSAVEYAGHTLELAATDEDFVAVLQVIIKPHEAIFRPRLDVGDNLVVDRSRSAATTHNAVHAPREMNLVQHVAGVEAGEDITPEQRLDTVNRSSDVLSEASLSDAGGVGFHTPRYQVLARPVLLIRLRADRVPTDIV